MKPLFDLLTSPLGLPISPLHEWIILTMIGEMAYRVAFDTVGGLYDDGLINSGCLGSILHWIIRFIIFTITWAATYGVISTAKFVIAHKEAVTEVAVCAFCMAPVIIAAAYRGKGE